MEQTQKLTLPKEKLVLQDMTPSVVNLTIKLLTLLGVPIYKETDAFDSTYPALCYDLTHITQRRNADSSDGSGSSYKQVATAEEFIAYFSKPIFYKIQLNEANEYETTVYADRIRVGCQTITEEKIEEILSLMKKLK